MGFNEHKRFIPARILNIILFTFAFLLMYSQSVQAETYQPALWFMDDLNITQEPGGGYSHSGTLNFDVKGVNNLNIKAPFDCEIVAIFPGAQSGNTVIVQSVSMVLYANGTVDYMSLAVAHDNDISDCYVGKRISQGEIYYQNGNYGNADGIHSHVTCIGGRYTDHPGWIKVSSGNSTFRNAINPVDALYLSPSTRIWNTAGLSFRTYNPSGYLDINGLLDGSNSGGLYEYGTCDVYINGSLVANDVNDFYQEYAQGTSYRIEDIKAKSGFSYDGVSGSLSGTIPSGGTVDVRLKFNSCRLDVNGLLDGKVSGTIGTYGTFDVKINGTLAADDVNDYYERVPRGSSYEITDIRAKDGYAYAEGSNKGALEGTIVSGTTSVSLAFSTVVEAGAEWKEMDFLPANITSETCEIEYNNHYKKTSSTSPGSGWIKTGTGATTYVNDGGVYDSDFELATSETRVFVGAYYYHYCGATTGVNVEHYNDGTHTDYHVAGNEGYFYVSGGPWADDLDSRYTAYQISWRDGEWKNQPANCIAHRSAIYYKRYQYQNKKAVTDYIWERSSGWQSTKDSSANTVSYRFRLRNTENPVILSAEVTGITSAGYTVTCRATDNIGIVRAVSASWTDSEGEGNLTIKEIVPEVAGDEYKINMTIPISDHGSEYDAWYNTKIYVYDKVGNTAEYKGESIRAYIPFVVHSAKKLNLPGGVKEIEGSAFEGGTAFGEVILPDGVEKIGNRAFADCVRLVAIYMPDSVTEIEVDSFAESDNVVFICESNNTAAAFAHSNGIPYVTGE